MRNRIFIAPAGLLGFLLAACTTADAPVLTWVGEGVSIEVELTGIRHSTTGQLLHGDLRALATSGKLKAVDLRCVGIANGSMSSKQTYVSSYIDIIPSGYRANSKGIVEVAVYWAIPGLTQQDSLQSLKSAKIVIAKASEDPCFEFEK